MQPLRIFVVDDDFDTTESTSGLLRSLRHYAFSANSAETALANAPSCRPDVMLIDLAMPKFDGLELARCLRGRSQFAKTPLIAISGHVGTDFRQHAFNAGFDDFLPKPYWLADLKDALARAQERITTTQDAIKKAYSAIEDSREINRKIREGLDEFWRNHRRPRRD